MSPKWITTLRAFDEDGLSGGDEYKKLLKEILDRALIPEDRRPEKFHLASAVMRVNLQLAAVLLHELSHAFIRAYHGGAGTANWKEPWISGNRSNEIGCALENYIFGNRFYTTMIRRPWVSDAEHHTQVLASPFGLCFSDPWDAHSSNNVHWERVLTQPRVQAVCYPVPQRYVYKMHTDEMWGQRVPRYGLNALKLPRLNDWSTRWI